MAKKDSAGGFKQMPKMETTEPSVILKMKKGGHVNTKHLEKGEHGHTPMTSNTKHRESMECEDGDSPKKPSMSERKKAMNPNFKGGGKVAHKADGGMMANPQAMAAMANPAIRAAMAKRAMAKRAAMGQAAGAPMAAPVANPAMGTGLQPGMKKGGMAKGGDMAQDKAMIKKAFKQHDMQEHKGDKGTNLKLKTGGVTKSNAGGYKTGGVAMGAGGYAKGGIIKTENQGGEYRNTKMHTADVDHSPAKTGDVKLGNGGGYKDGGKASKKAYATGGSVNEEGKAVKMPAKPVSRPVANTKQSGTFAEGGSTSNDKYTVKDPKAVSDKASRELEDAMNPISMAKELYNKGKDYFTTPAGSVTKTEKSVTVSPGKKSGGKVC
jgi:hypothetical protein